MPSKLRIWYVSKYVAPPSGSGVGSRGYEIMRELAGMGHECLILTSDANHLTDVPEVPGSHLVQERDGLNMCWVRTAKAPEAESVRRIASWLHFEWALLRLPKRDFSLPDVVIVSSLSLLTIINGLWLRRKYRARLVLEIRDIWPLTLVEEGGYSPRNPLVVALAKLEKLGYARADAIVGTMPNLREHVERVLGYPKEVHCIPMGYSPEAIAASQPLPLDYVESYLSQDQFVIGYAGTVGITNALDSFFEAAESMRDDHGVRFLVVGDGALLADYKHRFSHLPNLTFGPKVPKHSVQAVLAACDLLFLSVHKSKVWQYGQSLNKVIDYMLAGRPIVASYSGFPSMIDEANCGSLVPAGDVPALVREFRRFAAMTTEERNKVGGRGRSWILEHRSFRRLADDYLPILLARN